MPIKDLWLKYNRMARCALNNVPAAVDVDHLAADVIILDEEDHGIHNVLRAACAFEERAIDGGLLLFSRVVVRKQDRSGRDRIHLDIGREGFRKAAVDGD